MDPKINLNGFDPSLMVPTTSYQPPPAYNPNMTQPQEPHRGFTVKHQPGVQTVMIQHSAIAFGPVSAQMACPWCKSDIATQVKDKATTKTHFAAILLCIFGCCLIPYVCSSCQSQQHYCPNCKRFLGSFDN